MSLFDGVENFTPAFTGQKIAIETGQGAGQSISRGMATAQRGKAQKFEQDTFNSQVGESAKMAQELEAFMNDLRTRLGGY